MPVPTIGRIEKCRVPKAQGHRSLEYVQRADSFPAASIDRQPARTVAKSNEVEDDIRFIVDYFAPMEGGGPAEFNPYHDQICGVWVGMLPLLPAAGKNEQYFRSAVKTLATSLRRHGFKSRRCEPDMLEMYGDSIAELGRALEAARGIFKVDLGVAILSLAVADVGPVLSCKHFRTCS